MAPVAAAGCRGAAAPGRIGHACRRPKPLPQEIQTAIGAARDAQKKGDFAAYGAALQRLDDAITKYNNTK